MGKFYAWMPWPAELGSVTLGSSITLDGGVGMEAFADIYETLKKADPEARVMIGETAESESFEDLLTCLGKPWETGVRGGGCCRGRF